MSGGIDSSVAVYLLREAGYRVVGLTLRLADPYLDDHSKQYKVIERAAKVCEQFGIEHIVADYTEKFRSCVVDKFADAYFSGITPNPCIECNRFLKWDALLGIADQHDIPLVATGHYARIGKEGRTFRLLKGRDALKDQSYFLWRLQQEQLARTVFPLGEMHKKEVIALASGLGLPQSGQAESQDICYIQDNDYKTFLATHYPERVRDIGPGKFIDRQGKVLGEHEGYYRYTVGQRKGLGVAAGEPLYVLEIQPENNTVILGNRMDTEDLGCTIGDVNWMLASPPGEMFDAGVKVRYRGKIVDCRIEPLTNGHYHILFREVLHSVTPGQSAVFYDHDMVIGGGIILGKESK
jgi:tRNA-specific 2-thiouridylase